MFSVCHVRAHVLLVQYQLSIKAHPRDAYTNFVVAKKSSFIDENKNQRHHSLRFSVDCARCACAPLLPLMCTDADSISTPELLIQFALLPRTPSTRALDTGR